MNETIYFTFIGNSSSFRHELSPDAFTIASYPAFYPITATTSITTTSTAYATHILSITTTAAT
jgi:hypothetical protein